jgi:hypothetical protein
LVAVLAAFCFAGNISMRVSFNANVPPGTVTITATIADGLSMVAAIFAYLVVEAIDQRQEETSAKANLGKFSGPPPPPNLAPDALAPAP